ncbi:Rieske 2Fe-2S domain-containing protein [Caenimonas sedimenti]|uniref:Rieske 2Fe-2S domain-containing protein n=1 Tax=Caenimonas sedimenti TaxID=2596921 RepID=A0A562ZWC0_9BURK|nr:Rieske 2Fe-2S domain-containing protein [Caenimonas sedimenti]TWO72912.1 Rieske 2Fe-2S domain-containing protein [Caenimonas sedimenti]
MRVRLCHAQHIPAGGARGFDPAGSGRDTMFVVRSTGAWRAWRNSCPHWQGTPMAWRKDAYLTGDGRQIRCSAHGALFDLESGLCTLGPCVGESLTPVPLIQTADGHLEVDLGDIQETPQ